MEHSFQRGKPVSLNPDHTHFLLVDDGTQGQCGAKEVLFRARLERVIADKPNIQKQSTLLPTLTAILEPCHLKRFREVFQCLRYCSMPWAIEIQRFSMMTLLIYN